MVAVRFPYERRVPRIPLGNDLPEQGGYTGQQPLGSDLDGYTNKASLENRGIIPGEEPAIDPVIARQMERADGYVDKGRTINPALPSPPPTTTEAAPVPAPDAEMPAAPELPEPPHAPVYIRRDSRGRPDYATGGDTAAERNRSMTEAVDTYTPQKKPKWRRYLRLAGLGGSMIGSAIGHDSSGVAVATYGLGRHLFNSKAADEDWKRGKQLEVQRDTDRDLSQRQKEATIANTEALPELRREAYRLRQVGLDTAGKRVSDARMKAALESYHKNDYTPGKNPALDKYYEDSGLHGLVARKKDDKWEYKLIDGDLLRVPKEGTGGAENVTFTAESGGGLVTDPAKTANQSIKIGDVTYEHLTPREVSVLAGRAYEGAQGRTSREGIAARAQAGANARDANNGTGGIKPGAINASVKGAVGALSKFRSLTVQIEKAKVYYGVQTNDAIQALYNQRDGLERDMKQLYGQYLELDEGGKPAGLKESAYASAGPGLTIEGAIQAFKSNKKKNPTGRAPTQQEIENMQKAIDALR